MIFRAIFDMRSIAVVCLLVGSVLGDGLLLLYRPKDISGECAASRHLRFDLSFGMGMSDTTTLLNKTVKVFRTLNDFDYGCVVEVSTEAADLHLLVVIRYPNSIANNCALNRDAFTVFKRSKCLRLCDLVGPRDILSPYYIITLRERLRFRFISNSSVNTDMNANLYQVTVTAARTAPTGGCSRRNETICTIDGHHYCFTSGVVCDGINNCGVADWFDERKAQCSLPVERLDAAPVIAVLCAVLCALLVGGRALARCLPPNAASFFIFNANEDNRLYVDTVHRSPDHAGPPDDPPKRISIIPIYSDSSSESNEAERSAQAPPRSSDQEPPVLAGRPEPSSAKIQDPRRDSARKFTMQNMTASLQRRLRTVVGHRRQLSFAKTEPLDV